MVYPLPFSGRDYLFFCLQIRRGVVDSGKCIAIAGINYLLSRVFGDSYMFLLPWNLDAAFYALPFYTVANVMWRHLSHEQFLSGIRKNLPASGLVIVVLGLLLCYLAFNFHECSMGSSSYQCAIGIFFVRAFVGCVWLLIICGLLTISSLYF